MPDTNHVDIPHLDVPHHDNPHNDLGHQDSQHQDSHLDFGHDDFAHLDSPHIDSHQDFGHFDIGHIDLFHTDLPHDDLLHIDDVGHSDSLHTDFGHIDQPHVDGDHLDIVHADAGHDDLHFDVGHADADHGDAHSDIFHMDALHLDLHLDITHSDDAHSDDAHSDDTHSDDTHSDDTHSDDTHSDAPFDDGHIDVPFNDAFSDGGFGDDGGGFGDDGGGGGGGGCFTAETRVAMPNGGSKPIGEVAVGDYVLARSEKTGSLTARRVSGLFTHRVDQTLQLRLSSGDAIETTREHRFFVLGQGFIAAGRLRAGDQLVAHPDPITVEAVEPRPGPKVVYNLSVEHDATYLVGPRGLVVHVIKEDAAPAPRPGAGTAMVGQIEAYLQSFGEQMAQQIKARDRAADQRLVQVLGEVTRFVAEVQNALRGLERRVQRLEGRSGHPGGTGHRRSK